MGITKDEKVKKDILAAAQELFRQYGLKKTTMDEIAAACGKAKSTLYHYFKNKDEVFDGVLMKEMFNIRKVVSEKVDSRISLQDKIKVYLITFHTEAIQKINLFRILQQKKLEELANFDRLKKAIEFEKDYIEGIITRAFDNGEYHGIERNDIPMFSEILVVSFLGLVKYSVEKDQGIEFHYLTKMSDLIVPKIFS